MLPENFPAGIPGKILEKSFPGIISVPEIPDVSEISEISEVFFIKSAYILLTCQFQTSKCFVG